MVVFSCDAGPSRVVCCLRRAVRMWCNRNGIHADEPLAWTKGYVERGSRPLSDVKPIPTDSHAKDSMPELVRHT